MVVCKSLLVFSFFLVSVFGYDYKQVPKHHRSGDFKSLAKNLDTYFTQFSDKSVNHPKRNKFEKHIDVNESTELYERDDNDNEEEMIGLRGNFATEHKPGVTPRDIMRDISDDVPVSPLQWEKLMSPFVSFIPNIADYCECQAFANCGCCLGIYLKPIKLRENICINATMSRDAQTHSNIMARVKLYLNIYKLIDVSVSEKQPPTACLSIIPFGELAACVQVGNLHVDKAEHKSCVCASLLIQTDKQRLTHSRYFCACAGKSYREGQTTGILSFGMQAAQKIFGTLFIPS